MFCYQCEQTAKGTGCTVVGVCGKSPEVAALQDLLIAKLVQMAKWAYPARKAGQSNQPLDLFIAKSLFTTVTNVNFDPERLAALLYEAVDLEKQAGQGADSALSFDSNTSLEALIGLGQDVSIVKRKEALGEDVTALEELLTYGLKGAAAYMHHAEILGQTNPAVYDFFLEALAFLGKSDPTVDELVSMSLRCGEVNISVMELLDAANTGAYGHPVPTAVRVEPIKGKAILVSGHDLKDLEELLKQTEGKGINIYTHGEMLPAHGYPELKKYSHLAGNYGGAWQDQKKEFDAFPGSILMTTNCIQKPKETYFARIFTTGLVAWPGVTHIKGHDYASVIDAALAAEGFTEDGPEKTITVGFGRNAVLGVADKVIEAVKGGDIKHFFLIGGCDGAKSGRNYFTDLAKGVPDDSVILTLACGKYRFNKLDFGDIGGIPRLLDIGQCNDAYSAVKIALALADAFDTDVNGLPLSLVISWYEQKAVAILLSLLHLGVKDIRLGPSLPAFVTPAVLDVLIKNYDIKAVSTPEEDLKAILG